MGWAVGGLRLTGSAYDELAMIQQLAVMTECVFSLLPFY